jgi:hypothetical protein
MGDVLAERGVVWHLPPHTHHSVPHAGHVAAICLDGLQYSRSKSAWIAWYTCASFCLQHADCAMSRTPASSFVCREQV